MLDLIKPWGQPLSTTTYCGRGGSLAFDGRSLAVHAFELKISLYRNGDETRTRTWGLLQVVVRNGDDLDFLRRTRDYVEPVDLTLSVSEGAYRFAAKIGDPESRRGPVPLVDVDFEGSDPVHVEVS